VTSNSFLDFQFLRQYESLHSKTIMKKKKKTSFPSKDEFERFGF